MKKNPWLLYIPLVILGATTLLPLIFMVVTALSKSENAFQSSGSLSDLIIPKSFEWRNFVRVWGAIPFLRYYFNSILVSIVVTFGQVLTSACAAYAFSRFQWPGRDKLFLAYLATIMVPGSVTMLPNFITMKMAPEFLGYILPGVDWQAQRYLGFWPHVAPVGRFVGLDSFFALIAPGVFSAYGTFLLRQFFLSIPKELEEAARIDGCNYWQIFTNVMLPLAKPALATLSIFTFLASWTGFLWPLIVTNQDAMRTLPVGLQAFQGQYATEWPLLMAASLMMLFPVIVIFLYCQRYLIEGLTDGAVKG